MCIMYIYIYIYRERERYIDGIFHGDRKGHPHPHSENSRKLIKCSCQMIYTHTHTPTYLPNPCDPERSFEPPSKNTKIK